MKYLFRCFLFLLILPINAQKYIGSDQDISNILSNIKLFSQAIMDSNYQGIGEAYTKNAKIFPANTKVIEGREAIIKYWTPKNGSKIVFHKVTPNEIKVIGDEAYDYGYYQGITKSAEGKMSEWKGKYVIVWKKVNSKWLIYLDIWNRVPNDKKK